MSRRIRVMILPSLVAFTAITQTQPAAADPSPPLPAGASFASPTAPPGWQREAMVLSSGKPVTLQVRRYGFDGSRTWSPVCASPCQATVWAGAEYRIAGAGVTRSASFVVAASDSPLTLRADPGSLAASITGDILVPIGAVSLVYGTVLVAMRDTCFEDCSSSSNELVAPGLVMMGLGAAALAAGIAFILSSDTTVKQSDFGYRGMSLGKAWALTPGGLRF